MEELIERLKKGEEAALREVMRMYKKPLLNFLNLMVGNRELAEELTQDTFVKVYFKAKTIQGKNLKPWIYTIAINLARSEFRKKRIKAFFSLEDVSPSLFAFTTSPFDKLVIEQTIQLVPDKYRIPLIMKEVDNFSFEEIAEMLQKPIGTVKSLVFRGKEMLRHGIPCGVGGGGNA